MLFFKEAYREHSLHYNLIKSNNMRIYTAVKSFGSVFLGILNNYSVTELQQMQQSKLSNLCK